MKYYILLILFVMGCAPLSAQHYKMKMEKQNGENIEKRADEVEEVVFNGGKILVKEKGGSKTEYAKGEIRKIYFLISDTKRQTLNMQLPRSIKTPTSAQLQISLTNLSTNQTYKAKTEELEAGAVTMLAEVPAGNYKIAAIGTIDFEKRIWIKKKKKWQVIEMKAQVKAEETVSIAENDSNNKIEIPLKSYTDADGFLITEVFFASPPNREYDDQYIKIGNNTDSVKYADGLAIVESGFNTNDSTENNPQFMDEMMTITWAYVIPGTGRDVPVKPGEELLIALNAENYKAKYGSFDLSHADFEFYDKTGVDVDNKDVPDLENWTKTNGMQTTLSTRGCKALGLVKMNVDREIFRKNFCYTYSEKDLPSGFVNPEVFGHVVPNAWAVDVVEIAAKEDRQWNVFDRELDCGFTYATQHHVGDDYGKAVVRRKIGKKWRDTNNSSKDFQHNASATMY